MSAASRGTGTKALMGVSVGWESRGMLAAENLQNNLKGTVTCIKDEDHSKSLCLLKTVEAKSHAS